MKFATNSVMSQNPLCKFCLIENSLNEACKQKQKKSVIIYIKPSLVKKGDFNSVLCS